MKNDKSLLWWGILFWLLVTFSRAFGQGAGSLVFLEHNALVGAKKVQEFAFSHQIGFIQPMIPKIWDPKPSWDRQSDFVFHKIQHEEGRVAARKRTYLPGAKVERGPHGCE